MNVPLKDVYTFRKGAQIDGFHNLSMLFHQGDIHRNDRMMEGSFTLARRYDVGRRS